MFLSRPCFARLEAAVHPPPREVELEDATLADHERPLAKRGRRASKAIARHLRREGVTPELVLCSSAIRTLETLERIEPELEGAKVQIEARIYEASAGELLALLREPSTMSDRRC